MGLLARRFRPRKLSELACRTESSGRSPSARLCVPVGALLELSGGLLVRLCVVHIGISTLVVACCANNARLTSLLQNTNTVARVQLVCGHRLHHGCHLAVWQLDDDFLGILLGDLLGDLVPSVSAKCGPKAGRNDTACCAGALTCSSIGDDGTENPTDGSANGAFLVARLFNLNIARLDNGCVLHVAAQLRGVVAVAALRHGPRREGKSSKDHRAGASKHLSSHDVSKRRASALNCEQGWLK